jgi:hypothetical protein
MEDFNKKTIRALADKGITIMGATFLPDHNGSFLNGRRGYRINDNGTGRVWTYHEIINMVSA